VAELKEIKDIKIVPFTLLTSSVSAVLAFIGAIIMILVLGVASLFIPAQFTQLSSIFIGLGIAAIIIYPIGTFLLSVMTGFISVLLYNCLVPRIGGVKLAMDGNNLESVSVIPLALILSIIAAIWAFVIGLMLAAVIPLIAGAINASGSSLGTAIPVGSIGALGLVGALILIIGLPILAFIGVFISYALYAIFYNYIATRVAKIQLNFNAVTGTWFDLVSVPAVPAALAVAVVFTVFGLIQGILSLIGSIATGNIAFGLGQLVGNVIGSFIQGFIITAIAAVVYNFLVPKLCAIKLKLE
jgi:hypothetical protein